MHEQFLGEIIARPHDEDVPVAYAWWLEQTGEPDLASAWRFALAATAADRPVLLRLLAWHCCRRFVPAIDSKPPEVAAIAEAMRGLAHAMNAFRGLTDTLVRVLGGG